MVDPQDRLAAVRALGGLALAVGAADVMKAESGSSSTGGSPGGSTTRPDAPSIPVGPDDKMDVVDRKEE